MAVFPGACALLLLLALGVGLFLHGGYLYAAFAWPGIIAVCAASFLTAAYSLLEERLPDVRIGALLLATFVAWFIWRWFSTGATSPGFLPVALAGSGLLAFGVVTFGMRKAKVRLFFVLGILALGILQLVEIGAWRISNQGFFTTWFSEQLRLWLAERVNRRLSGFFLSKNHFAWFINACAIFALSICVWARIPPYFKFLAGWTAGFFAFACILSLSRGGAIGLATGLFAFTFVSMLVVTISRSRFRSMSILFLAFVLAALTGAILWLIVGDYALQERLSMIGNDVYREEQWKSALRQFEKEPIIGTGTGTFADYSRIYRPWRTAGSEAIYAHNDLLQVAAETGWIGFGLLVLAVGSIAWASLRGLLEHVHAWREEALVQSNHCVVVVGGLACLAAFAVHSVFDNNMHLAPNGLLGFVVLGLVASGATPIRTITSSAISRRVFHFVPAFALILGASAFLLWSTPRFKNEFLLVCLQNNYLRNQPAKAISLAESVAPDLPFASASLHLAAADVWQAASVLPAAVADPELALSLLRRAEAQCDAALPYAPLDRYPHLRIAAIRSLLGDYFGAYQAAEQAILLDPQTAFPYEYMGGVLESAGQLSIALRYYTLALDLGTTSAFPAARAKEIRQALQSLPTSR